MLNVSERLMGTRLNPSEEYRTWVFSDPHFEHEASVALLGRPFRNRHHGDGYLWSSGRTTYGTTTRWSVWATSPWTARRTA